MSSNKKNNPVFNMLQLPKVRQIGVVVKSTEETSRYYSDTFGIGPWYRPNPKTIREEHFLNGREKIEVKDDILLAFSGSLQIELIEPRSIENDIYHEHLIKFGEGIHHLGFCISDIDQRTEALQATGIDIIQTGVMKSGGAFGGSITRYAYFDTRKTGGIIIELIQTKLFGVSIPMSRLLFEAGCLFGDMKRS